MRGLRGRRVLVTGGAKGIGAGVARRMVEEGAEVVIADLDRVAGDQLAKQLGVVAWELDASDTEAVHEKLASSEPFDVLVNNVGLDQHSWFTSTSSAQWRKLTEVNFYSVLAATHGVLPGMQRSGYGRLIHIGSEAARLGSAGGAVYAAAKGAVIAFSRSVARENARYGITSNVIVPGPVDTPMLQKAVIEGGDKLHQAMINATLVRRLGTVEEVAAAVAFLASSEAGFITGEVLGVSGGMGCGQ